MSSTYKTTIERHVNGCDCELNVTVEYTAYPFVRGSFFEPDEPAHIEIESVREDETGGEIELTSAQEDAIERQIAEDLNDADAFAREQHYDRMRDERAERGSI